MSRYVGIVLSCIFACLASLSAVDEKTTATENEESFSDFSTAYANASNAFSRVYQKAIQTITLAQHELEWLFEARSQFEEVAFSLMSKTFWTLLGYNPDSTIVGVTSGKEASDKARITLINGMLNAHSHVLDAAEVLSEMHGNTAVHYLYAASSGFSADVLHGIFSKMGFHTPEAALLVKTWRQLIDEMGGVHSGGKIIHYAHSLGGSDTEQALQEMTPEERKMIHIITFGSAALIDRKAAAEVHNYVSHGDPIPLFDPVRYVEGWRGVKPEVVFLPSKITFDHSIAGVTYRATLEDLGRQFQQEYVKDETKESKTTESTLPDSLPVKMTSSPLILAKKIIPAQEAALPVKSTPPARTLIAKSLDKEPLHVEKRVLTSDERAEKAYAAILHLRERLGLRKSELRKMCHYIESTFQENIQENRYYILRKEKGLARDIEYDPKTGRIFIHLGTKGIERVGAGFHKLVTKSILYDIEQPEIVAHCRASIQDLHEMKIAELLQGERGIVEGKAFIQHSDKLEMIFKLYNANTIENIHKNKSEQFSLREKMEIALDLLYGLTSMHERNLMHRDLHVGNVLIDIQPPRQVKAVIIDFGRTLPKEKCRSVEAQGYGPCVPPEAFFLKKLSPKKYPSCDIYALGCTLYSLYYEKEPPWFSGRYCKNLAAANKKTKEDRKKLLSLLRKKCGKRREALSKKRADRAISLEEEFEYLILRMLHEEAGERGSAQELRDLLQSLQQRAS